MTLHGVEISGIESGEVTGGAVLVDGANATLKLEDVCMFDISADIRGGAVACEECKRLSVSGFFFLVGNQVGPAVSALGGAIHSDGPVVVKGVPSRTCSTGTHRSAPTPPPPRSAALRSAAPFSRGTTCRSRTRKLARTRRRSKAGAGPSPWFRPRKADPEADRRDPQREQRSGPWRRDRFLRPCGTAGRQADRGRGERRALVRRRPLHRGGLDDHRVGVRFELGRRRHGGKLGAGRRHLLALGRRGRRPEYACVEDEHHEQRGHGGRQPRGRRDLHDGRRPQA